MCALDCIAVVNCVDCPYRGRSKAPAPDNLRVIAQQGLNFSVDSNQWCPLVLLIFPCRRSMVKTQAISIIQLSDVKNPPL